ncbi:MAG: efflux RND transporter permease subunit [Halothiobacillaceae bacterium]
MISKFFVDRPVFATVIAIVIVLSGMVAFKALPVEQYPQIVPPQVSVTATYGGASAEVIAESVAATLEQQINGVDDMLYMESSSSDAGYTTVTVTFANGTDADQATINVSNRVQQVSAKLPEEVREQGVVVQKQSSSLLMVLTLVSESGQFDSKFMSNYALVNVIDDIKRLPGVGEAKLFAQEDYSIRIWLESDKLAQFGLTPDDVATAIRTQSAQFATGKLGAEPTPDGTAFTYTLINDGRFTDVSQFREIILRGNEESGTLRLDDVARIELGTQVYGFDAVYGAQPTTPIGIYLQPGANALETATAVRALMEEVSARFPGDIRYEVPLDTTDFVKVSIEEVYHTFFEALILVVLVIFVFLQKPRTTLIPLLAIPVALIGTMAGLYAAGFSLNLLTLFGLVLAIGIVVDDAIVVIENVERIMEEERLEPRAATIKAMEQVQGAIVATTLVLLAVFIPVAFIPGMAGEMYRQFAVAISIAVVISALIALTLTPSLCAHMLSHRQAGKKPLLPFRLFNSGFAGFTAAYMHGVRFFLRFWPVGLGLFAVVMAAALWMFQTMPTSLVPDEDQGYFISVSTLPPAASLERSIALRDQVDQQIREIPQVDSNLGLSGYDLLAGTLRTNASVSFTRLTDWSERTGPGEDAQSLTNQVMFEALEIEDGQTFAFNPPPISGMSTTGGLELYLQSRVSQDPLDLAQAASELVQAASARPELTAVRTTYAADVPRYRAVIDREKAYALGVSVAEVFSAMSGHFGTVYVNDFSLFGRNFQVRLSGEGMLRADPDDLRFVFVRSTQDGAMVPLDALVTLHRESGPDVVDRFNLFPSAKLMANPAPGYTSGQAIEAMQEVAEQTLSSDFSLGWTGSAYQEISSGQSGSLAFLFGLIMVFLILAAQYERWTLPFAVVTAVPFAALGALIATWMRGLSIDIYFEVGLLVLIGLAAKNAILIIEFAAKNRDEGMPIREAALEAAKLRFRPVIMTSMAFILGVLPLAIATGAGEAARHSLGTGLIGGMILATYVAILFVPMFFELIQKLAERRRKPG